MSGSVRPHQMRRLSLPSRRRAAISGRGTDDSNPVPSTGESAKSRSPRAQRYLGGGVDGHVSSSPRAVGASSFLRNFKTMSAERGASAAGVVRYWYAVRFLNGSPQI